MITEETMPESSMRKAEKDGYLCAKCQGRLSFAWGSAFGVNGWILRCQDITHTGVTRHDKKYEKEIKEAFSMESKALQTMTETQMVERVNMARFPQDLTIADKKLLAQVAITYGFDPLMGEVTIYQGRPYVSIDGRYRKAQETGNLDGVETRPATKQEREGWQIPEGDYFFRSEVYVKGTSHPFVAWGRVRGSETHVTQGKEPFLPVQKNPQRMAEKRAEAQALRKSFHIPLPSVEDIGSPDYDVESTAVEVDKVTGEIKEAKVEEPKKAQQASPERTDSKSDADEGEVRSPTKPDTEKAEKDIEDMYGKPEKSKRDPATVKSIHDLMVACNQDFKLQPKDVLKELNLKSVNEIADVSEAYKTIAAVR